MATIIVRGRKDSSDAIIGISAINGIKKSTLAAEEVNTTKHKDKTTNCNHSMDLRIYCGRNKQ